MKHFFKEENGVVILEPEGRIMGTTHDTSLVDLTYKFIDQEKVQVVLDLSRVEWMNSRGLGIFITMLTALNNRGGGLKLASPSEKVQSFLDKCKMFAVFETYDTVEEAVRSFR